MCRLPEEAVVLWQQNPRGIDAGAFHTDVLAVGCGSLLLFHELAFTDAHALVRELSTKLGHGFRAVMATDNELPVADAVAAYPFNSQLVCAASGDTVLLAPRESHENPRARGFLERLLAERHIDGVDYLDVNGSMRNGGGPACLRLRVPLTDSESVRLSAGIRFDPSLEGVLRAIIERRYRDRVDLGDMADPEFVREARTALDEVSSALGLTAIYDFQR